MEAGDAATFYEQIGRQSAPEWRGPAAVLHIGDTRAPEKFRRRTLEFACFCVREQKVPKNAVNLDVDHPPRIAGAGDDWDIVAAGGDVLRSLTSSAEAESREAFLFPVASAFRGVSKGK